MTDEFAIGRRFFSFGIDILPTYCFAISFRLAN